DGLEVGEAPPGLPERGLDLDRLAVSNNPVRLPPDSLQHVAVTKPNAWLLRQLRQDILVQSDCFVEISQAAERRRLEVPVTDLVRFLGKDVVEELQGLRRAPHSSEDQRQVRLCSG